MGRRVIQVGRQFTVIVLDSLTPKLYHPCPLRRMRDHLLCPRPRRYKAPRRQFPAAELANWTGRTRDTDALRDCARER